MLCARAPTRIVTRCSCAHAPIHHRELRGVAVPEVLREAHPAIGHARLLAQDGDAQRAVPTMPASFTT
eukprot:4738916-Lingulodinium_polyedra.AAC.1